MKGEKSNSYQFKHLPKHLVIIVIFLFSTLSFSQSTSYIDSLKLEMETSVDPKLRFSKLLEIINYYSGIDSEKALLYAKTAMIESESTNNSEGIANLSFIIGGIYEGLDDYDNAITNYQNSLEQYTTIKNTREAAKLYYSLGDIYKKKGYYQQSLENCLNGLRIYEELNDRDGLSNVYNVMGSLYKYQNNSIKSLEYYNKSLEIRVELNDLNGMAMCYNNIGVVYEIEGNTDLALDYYNRGLKMFIESNDVKNQGITLGNIGSIYLTHGESEKALEFFNKSLDIHNRISYSRGLANQYQNLGQYYELIGNHDLAIEYTERAYNIYKTLSRLEDEKETAVALSNLYKSEKKFQKAYNYLLISKELNDKLFDNEKIKNIARMESEYMHLKEDEIRNLEDQKRRLVNTSIFLALAFITLIGASLYSRLRIKIRQQSRDYIDIDLEKRQIETELELKEREMATNAIYLVKKNEIISDVVERLNRAKANLKEENKPIISDIINDLSGSIDKDIWDDFEIRFLNVHNNFYDNLQERYPGLTANEKRISAFIRLNMSTKEISSITNQTPHSINIARTRLRKKLGLSNTDTNLSSFLSQF